MSPRAARPWLAGAVAAALAAWAGLSETALGRALAPSLAATFGEDSLETALPVAAGLFVGLVFALNILALRTLPFRAQVVVIWVELFALFLAFFDAFGLSYAFIGSRLPILIFTGAVTTVYVSALSIVAASVIALVAALARLSRSGPAFGIATFYISFFRGTPLLLQVYLIYLGLPQLGLTLPAVPSGVIALSLCYGAYMAEIVRAGIEGVPHGQAEAARALGLKRDLVFRKIVFPQAMRLIVPPTGNQFIAMLKDSALVSVMGVWELMFLARTQGRAEFRHLEMLITAALVYWALSVLFELGQARLERHYGRGTARPESSSARR